MSNLESFHRSRVWPNTGFKLALLASLCTLPLPSPASNANGAKTAYYSVVVTPNTPGILSLAVDSLGRGEFRPSALSPASATGEAAPKRSDAPAVGMANDSGWSFRFAERSIDIETTYRKDGGGDPIRLRFDPESTHATLLGENNHGQVSLPALLHLPEQGSLRIEAESAGPVKLGYDAHRKGKGYVEVSFPAATAANPRIVYSLTVAAIYPPLKGIEDDPRYDGFRRNYLNALQVHAEYGVLANHAASDPCAFVVYMYSEVAKHAPPLAPGLTAMDMVRMTLDRYLNGFIGYGLPGFKMFDSDEDPTDPSDGKATFLDTYPSLLIAAGDYVETTHDQAWLGRNYGGLRKWTEAMLSTDSDNNGLLKYAAPGDSGSWKVRANGKVDFRPANWWDTIGFGYEDAYSNALAYHALEGMAAMARLNKQNGDATRYTARAKKLRDAYVPAFLNPKTGVLGGWRSADGVLHDYYFPFVNGAAVVYGLVSPELGNTIFDRLLAKMKQVGYTNFELGLPGNLIPIRKEDYVDADPRYGGPAKDDGSDGFQIYENGGATASFAYFSIVALYKLGRVEDGDRLLFPMLKSFRAGAFEGRGANGMTYDWKAWDGTPHGYEGFLADNFMTLAAVMARPQPAAAK